ncbi:MAG: 16S rRNA (cytidine(1402)-2'-O)-methyltransferase [Desulfobacterales bacterium]
MNSPTNNVNRGAGYGILYVVATPIGNLDDITLRALTTLDHVDVIAAEDTRHTGILLKKQKVKNKLISYHEHNEKERTALLMKKLKSGLSVALVSNAGTPALSDPGYYLIKTAIEDDIKVTPIPGASAATAALSVSGLPTDSFVFIGFPAKKRAKRANQLDQLATMPRTLIFFESPKRIRRLVNEIRSAMGDRQAVLTREMTKLHEEFIRGTLSEILTQIEQRGEIKGEFTLLVSGHNRGLGISPEELRDELHRALKNEKTALSDLVKVIAGKYRLPKSAVYKEALNIKRKLATRDTSNGKA